MSSLADESWCNDFDRALAEAGPAAVFLRDAEGRWRFDSEWTRDAWGRLRAPPRRGVAWALARDQDSGYVLGVLITSPDLLVDHPRLQVRLFDARDAFADALSAFGRPSIAERPW